MQTGGFGNLLGSKPAGTTPSLFSGTNPLNTQSQTTPFGNTQTTAQPSLFGPKPAALIPGQSISSQPGLFGSTLGTATTVPASQPSLTASIAEPIGENLPIFALLPPGPRSIVLGQSQQKKKHNYFVDVPIHSILPRRWDYTPAKSQLRGSDSRTGSGADLTFGSMIGKKNALSLNGSLRPDDTPVGSRNPVLGSGDQSIKKIILDKMEPPDLFNKSGSSDSLRRGKIIYSPDASVAVRKHLAAGPLSSVAPQLGSSTITPRTINKFTADPAQNTGDTSDLREGDYYIKPDIPTLQKMKFDELASFKGLVVGRMHHGEIQFLEAVDLTSVPVVKIPGDVVQFDNKECFAYHDTSSVQKPSPGSGLNVRARVILEGCWAIDKATREPVKDPSDPIVIKHLKHLKAAKGTYFEDFDVDSGKWTFIVDHL